MSERAAVDVLSFDEYVKRATRGPTVKYLREWMRATLVPPAILRMNDIAHGITKFDTPTPAGNVVQIEAPPAVQRAALQNIIQLGLPPQLGLVDEDGETLPGVIALGQFDMDATQSAAHAARYTGIGPAIDGTLAAEDRVADVLPPSSKSSYELPPDHEMVVVEEGVGTEAVTSEDRAPAPIDDTPTPEQIALASHRERMKRAKHRPVPAAPSSITENLRD